MNEKLCECGCGQPTSIATQTRTNRGWVKGQPLRFINGHNRAGGEFPAIPAEQRFWDKVDKSNLEGCWLWTAQKNPRGYGLILRVKRNNYLAHRLSWEMANGPIPEGLGVLHKCDNPSCVRPDHLFVGTQADNIEDAQKKGRLKPFSERAEFTPHNTLKTHCKCGLPLSGDNLYTTSRGRRDCKACMRSRQQRYRARQRVRFAGALESGVIEA